MKNKKENDDFLMLCDYVKKDILEYDDSMKLPRFMILRLRGLSSGNFMANNRQKPMARYSYEEILMTFKAYKHEILKYTKQNTFKDEQHRFNYILVIIENNINDIVLRLQNVKNQEKKIDTIDGDIIQRDDVAEYIRKGKETTNKRLDGLW